MKLKFKLTLLRTFFILFLFIYANQSLAQKGEFLSVSDFHKLNFPNQELQWQTLWLNKEQRELAQNILGRKLSGIRVRYMQSNNKTGWILEEIGKELPITVGLVVENGKLEKLEVLTYRESRGGEVRYPFFTKQFHQLNAEAPDWRLDKNIDGITGATLSVIALKKLARLALYYHSLAQQ